MSLSPSNILLRLQELQLWQKKQEKLLHNKNQDDSTASPYETIEGVRVLESPMPKNLARTVEEKHVVDSGPNDNNVVGKPKRPYLRKGAGLERYRLKPKPVRVRVNKAPQPPALTPLKAPDVQIQPKATWLKVDDSCEQSNSKLIEQSVEEIGDQTLELLLFEALEQRADNSSFCSTNSSVIQLLQSTPSKILTSSKKQSIIEESQWESKANSEFSDEEKWSTTSGGSSSSSSSSLSSITSDQLETTMRSQAKCDAWTETSDDLIICHKCITDTPKIIQEKDSEISKLRKHYKKELQQKSEQFTRELNKTIKQFEDEQRNLLCELETERKRIAKEKMVFEKYVKDSQNRPTRKEREELSNLKQELADTKELLKMKESKSGTTQARLRTQIKQFEKEVNLLKEEIEKLTKENARLLATQKLANRKPSDTKMLHEINKNLTKLAEETLKKRNKDEAVQEKSPVEKENSLDMTNFQSLRYLDVEKRYADVFGNLKQQNQSLNESNKKSEKTEEISSDGSKIFKYNNGNVKTISPDGNLITMTYFNGDIKITNLLEGAIKYFHSDQKIWSTNCPDGVEIIEFSNGQKEKRHKDGKCEISYPDNVIHTIFSDGREEIQYTDGSLLQIHNDERILNLPNGQKEIHTKTLKKREYPDGTVKILYNDGTQETRYSNGRIRIKDANGTLIMDNCDN